MGSMCEPRLYFSGQATNHRWFRAGFLITLFTARFTFTENARGRKHIFRGPLSRYNPNAGVFGHGVGYNFGGGAARDSEFLQYEK